MATAKKFSSYGYRTSNSFMELSITFGIFLLILGLVLGQAEEIPALFKRYDCLACHTLDKTLVGPSFQNISARYQDSDLTALVFKVKHGGSGAWGPVPMPPHPTISEQDLRILVAWILRQNPNIKTTTSPKGFPHTKPGAGPDYRMFPGIGSRAVVWIVAQLHLLFAAFVLAVPLFAFLIEIIGFLTKDKRYDRLAHEFTKLLSTSFSFTASLGAMLTFLLLVLYPKVMNYLLGIFGWSFLPYALLFFAENIFLYAYYYGWGKVSPRIHLLLGLGLNLVGTAILFIADAWLTFMMSPGGVSESGELFSRKLAFSNFLWMPINVHRLIANVAFGGSIAAAYGAFKFLTAKTPEEKAEYDWMGYVGNFVATSAFLPLPFAGYWLGKEIYAYSQNMGMVLMGGAFSWLFIIQAILIGVLFFSANYYLWLGNGRIQGSERFRGYIKWLLASITICVLVWATPHSLVATVEEARKMGGSFHPMLGVLGVMSAKNTAVNILILTTYMSFMLYRRGNKVATVGWYRLGNALQIGIFSLASAFVIFLGVYGYFVEAAVRIKLSVPQVLSVIASMACITALDVAMYRKPRIMGEIQWGKMPDRSQYALFLIAITFTWLMGLMGYARSGIRQHWHVYGVLKDTSVEAYTPTLGYAANIVSVTVLLFFVLIATVFWLSGLSSRKAWQPKSKDEK